MGLSPDIREIGHLATWTVSSAKPGNGVELLRDGREDTYWQSDGCQPHLVNIQFQKKMQILELHIYLDYKADESYTPSKVSVRVGTSYHDLKEVAVVELDEPVGWTRVRVVPPDAAMGDVSESSVAVGVKAFFVQVVVLGNHQQGRDTHVRQIRIFGPRTDPIKALGYPIGFTSNEFHAYATLR